MTKEQKILLLFVLLIAGSGAAVYVTQKSSDSVEQPVTQVQQAQEITNTTATNTTNTTNNTAAIPSNGTTAVSGTVATPTPTSTLAPAKPAPTPAKPVTPPQNKTIVETLLYKVPDSHEEEITVTAVVDAQGNIVDVTFAYGTPTNPESRGYLQRFNNAFSDATLIGTKPAAFRLSRVGGASLTTGAFNRAMQAIAEKI